MDKSNMFFVFYPCLFCGMVPVNLLAYDERSRWLQYSGTLPYTRAQIVSGKYLIGLICGISTLMTGLFREPLRMEIRPNLLLVLLAVAGVGIYALSWHLSIVFYRKREL